MTDLDSPRKNNDCYFYYYSTCSKGDNCGFRHEPSALGCETVCSFWKEGKCLNVHCNFRHMELRKNRKAIQCYWETQPGGCKKPHCVFLHQNKTESIGSPDMLKTQTVTAPLPNSLELPNEFKNSNVDSLVVNFEEESDNETSLFPSSESSPQKLKKSVKVKTLEEIKLEKIQAESAAFYSFPGVEQLLTKNANDLRQRILNRIQNKPFQEQPQPQVTSNISIGQKRKFDPNSTLDSYIQNNKIRLVEKKKPTTIEVDTIKIKTLAEIKAERMEKNRMMALDENSLRNKIDVVSDENLVTSTSKDDLRENTDLESASKIKLYEMVDMGSSSSKKITLDREFDMDAAMKKIENDFLENNGDVSMTKIENDFLENNDISMKKLENDFLENNDDVSMKKIENDILENNDVLMKKIENDILENNDDISMTQVENNLSNMDDFENVKKKLELEEQSLIREYERSESQKMVDEVLLLEDDDNLSTVSLKEEEELLKDIDDLLDDS